MTINMPFLIAHGKKYNVKPDIILDFLVTEMKMKTFDVLH